LESMISNPRPTRAEATDVANAVLDGSDCVMLSGETAKGAYPIETVRMMASICKEAEADIDYAELYTALRRNIKLPISVGESISSVAVKTSWDVRSPVVIVLSQTGQTAWLVCKYRPIPPVIAVTACPMVARQMQVLRGIYPFLVDSMHGTENIVTKAMLHAVQLAMAMPDDPIVITSGILEQTPGSTNMMKVKRCIGFES
jgi:pyruvate kinase